MLHYSTIVISVNFFELKSGLLFWQVEVNWRGQYYAFEASKLPQITEEEDG